MNDLEARVEALDPERSFIVQAPAGSGKTSLLTQRFLVLLGGVSVPEEILAITFTRKAAGEMRERILHALHSARHEPEPEDPFLAKTWSLAQKALERNDQLHWNLEDNPARLRVLTIDSLCARLAKGLPILSQFGASPKATEDASEFYMEAARRTLEAIHDNQLKHSDAVAHLLLHLDNNMLRVQQQVAEMLARRDKWMRPLLRLSGDLQEVGEDVLRDALEQTLCNIIEHHLEALVARFHPELSHQLLELCKFASSHLEETNPLRLWQDLSGIPGSEAGDLALWQALSELLLTGNGQWRKSLTKKQGFPAPSETKDSLEKSQRKAAKQQMTALLRELSDNDALRELLEEVRTLPPQSYTDTQWETLLALLTVSRLAAAQLVLVFKELGTTDFVEIAHRAERALGTDEEPTELALAMDAKLQHLLVDEFQDTSLGQIRLLERLTAEWYPGEGRTVFLVGDPMQSIYRFRDAEVGLFLQVRSKGLGLLKPEALTLRSNFRSQGALVKWYNETFSEVFPTLENPTIGSVTYSQAEAARPEEDDPVSYRAIQDLGDRGLTKGQEAETVVEILQETWREDPEASIAILVRSRGHLSEILPLLKSRGIRFQGVDLEPLAHRPAVRDLLSLTRALSRPGDRLAWLSVLRAPWCGLQSADLLAVANQAENLTIPSVLAQFDEISGLSSQGRSRLGKVWPPLSTALQGRQRHSLRRWVEATWLALGGPASLSSETALGDCHTFFALLEETSRGRQSDHLEHLVRRIDKLYAQADVSADGKLQIMTIHKSKGLEFDTVILPGLSNPSRAQEEPLVSWLEWSSPKSGESELLLAPVTEKGGDKDPVYSFVNALEKKKEHNETARLLYVAATRAKRNLHLLAQVCHDGKKDYGTLKPPKASTFLHFLWPPLEDDFALAAQSEAPAPSATNEEQQAGPAKLLIHRLSESWEAPELPADLKLRKTEVLSQDDLTEEPKFEWAGETVKHVGTVVHRVLQQMGREGLKHWSIERLNSLNDYLGSRLSHAGVPSDQLSSAVERSAQALREALISDRGRWILSEEHSESRSEYAVSGVWGERLVRSVVDRTFVDSRGTRWVIDYKTGSHEGADPETFLDQEVERYKPQLNRYARLLKRMDDRPVRMGIYFPLLKGWREWPLDDLQRTKQLEFEF